MGVKDAPPPAGAGRVRVEVDMTTGERAALVEIAALLGCVTTRGAAAGAPSIAVLLRDIAAGDLAVVRRAARPARRTASAAILELHAARPDLTGAEIAAAVGCQRQTVYAVLSRAARLARG